MAKQSLPLVSVIMPAFNRKHVIERAIESVLSQTFQSFELVVVDDGSTDDTPTLFGGIKDKRLKVLTQANKGTSAVRNKGLSIAKGNISPI